jgi:hypothetical protein
MRPYSIDLRERFVAAVDRGEHSLRAIAHLFSVNLSFLVRQQPDATLTELRDRLLSGKARFRVVLTTGS